MQIRYPVLKGDVKSNWPNDGMCPICRKEIRGSEQVAYLSAGACWDSAALRLDEHLVGGFLNVGVHGSRSDMLDSADVPVVEDVQGGQFDLQFCSLVCLRKWLNGLVDRLESGLESNRRREEQVKPAQ